MQDYLGWILVIFPGLLFLGQVISSVNFPLAQRLGLQEDPAQSDQLLQVAEKYVAYWDLVTLVWMPLAGLLMVLDHPAWPIVAFFAAAIYLDTSGREAAKILSFKQQGIRLGPERQLRLFLSTYVVMALLGVVVLVYALQGLQLDWSNW